MPASAGRSGGGGIEAEVQASDLLRLGRVLKKIDDKTVLKALRKGLREAATPIAAAARAGAPSPTIAKTVTVETAFTAKKSGVFISAKRNKMPAGHEALPGLFESGSKGNGGTFRHPVFGTDTWVSQDTHPFLAPALAGHEAEVTTALTAAIHDAIEASGLAVG